MHPAAHPLAGEVGCQRIDRHQTPHVQPLLGALGEFVFRRAQLQAGPADFHFARHRYAPLVRQALLQERLIEPYRFDVAGLVRQGSLGNHHTALGHPAVLHAHHVGDDRGLFARLEIGNHLDGAAVDVPVGKVLDQIPQRGETKLLQALGVLGLQHGHCGKRSIEAGSRSRGAALARGSGLRRYFCRGSMRLSRRWAAWWGNCGFRCAVQEAQRTLDP